MIATGYWDLPGTALAYEELKGFFARGGKLDLLIDQEPQLQYYQASQEVCQSPDFYIQRDVNTAWESLHRFILKVGVDKVRAGGLIANKIPLVSNTVDKKSQTPQKPLGNGWLLMTCSDTATKLTIAKAIRIRINVDII